MNERLEAIKASIEDSLEKAKTALNNKDVTVETLKVSEIPGYIRQIVLNKIQLTVNCSEFESGTIKATKDGKERVGTVEGGKAIIMLPSEGNWHIEHELGDYVETQVSGLEATCELVKKKATFSQGECSEEKIVVHVESVVGQNSNDNFIRVKKNGVTIEVQAQLKGSDIEITNFEYEEGATYTIEYVIKDEVRGSVEIEIVTIPSNQAGSVDAFFEGIDGITKSPPFGYRGLPEHIVFTDQKAPQDAKVSSWSANGRNGVIRWVDANTKTLYISTQEVGKKVILPEDCKNLFSGIYDANEFEINTTTKTIDLANVDSSHTTNMSAMFNGLNVTEIKNLNSLDTSNVTNMRYMFCNLENVESLDLNKFETSNVQNMNNMFSSTKKLNEIDLSSFNTDNVTDMSSMFSSSNITSIKFGQYFKAQNVRNMSKMFQHCIKLPKIDLSNFNIESVENTSLMFSDCSILEEVDLSTLKPDKLKDVSMMFEGSGSSQLKTIYATEWAKASITDINDNYMFENCTLLPNYSEAYSSNGWPMAKWKENGGYFTNPAEKPS